MRVIGTLMLLVIAGLSVTCAEIANTIAPPVNPTALAVVALCVIPLLWRADSE